MSKEFSAVKFLRSFEESQRSLESIRRYLSQRGHLVNNPLLERSLVVHVIEGLRKEKDILAACDRIERARSGVSKLTEGDVADAAFYGYKNLSRVDLSGLELEAFSLNDFNLFGTTLTDAHLDYTTFINSPLYAAKIDSIRVQQTSVDLKVDELALKGPLAWNPRNALYESIPPHDYELYFADLLNGKKWPHRQSIILYHEGHPIGIVASGLDHPFVPFRNVKDNAGNIIFLKGMVYRFSKEFRKHLTLLFKNYWNLKGWKEVNVENVPKTIPLSVANIRFIAEPEMYGKFHGLVEELTMQEDDVHDASFPIEE